MKESLIVLSALLLFSGSVIISRAQSAQRLPVHYEELTSPEFSRAVQSAKGVCILPLGILEKHGPHLPLGTDLLDVRELVARATKKEYAIVFPQYYFGQIFEAKHQPGTIAYSPDIVWKLLQETCDELGRNGITKIILVNGHGGNNAFLQYFCQAQLEKRRSYAVIFFKPVTDSSVERKARMLKHSVNDGHAGESETSEMFLHRPDLAHSERAGDQSGENLARLAHMHDMFTGIWWYARYPNHYSGDGSVINKELAELQVQAETDQLVRFIREVKQDVEIEKLQKEFYDRSENPMKEKK
ncbi:MAG: creatininase family protein [Ignavibacteriales bacterium]|nr:creatininase family protein [Ignavibacteriales bacterium]